ncbi:RHS repeat-associated core domain-containing protein [Paracoccus lutimaris]|uniref:RHS repeat-associated protein n=1 Tax=Paracoccus lutimaris TaxID=1490030 RepID=A0A368Z3M7_9RHOB|nr:RHS repeat-associated core domain-containing protein [Paracoccus lutimaris]RCW87062.1 RHS repeat-associated protein [Paracoccus lutimaris]
MPAALAAAHIGHQIEHSSAFMGFLVGAAVGLAVGVALVATVATGGAALAVIAAVGGAVAATGGGALAGMYIGEAITEPKGPVITGSANVYYGPARIPAARAVLDTVSCRDHGVKRIATGSDSVYVNQYPAVRDSDRTECDGEVKSDLSHIRIGAETLAYLPIESEVPDWMVNLATGMVLVGGAVALLAGGAAAFVAGSWCGLATFGLSVGLSYVGGAVLGPLGGTIGEALGGELGRRIGEVVGTAVGGALGGRFGQSFGRRVMTGHPIDVATGELCTTETEFVMGGPVPVAWERFWLSSSDQDGTLGRKWHHPLDSELVEAAEYTVLRLEHGRLILLPRMQPGQSFYHRAEKLAATRESDTQWLLRMADGLLRRMTACPGRPGRFRLTSLGDGNGNLVALSYDSRGCLANVRASDGIDFQFASDPAGRISEISRTDGTARMMLVTYGYDLDGNLISARNGGGIAFLYAYSQGLLVRETRRSGLSFYFEWDDQAAGPRARCLRTWGDGGIHAREITYEPRLGMTSVRNGKNHVERYFWDQRGLVTRCITPLGHESRSDSNRFGECDSSTDANGATERSRHDEYGRLVAHTDKTGATEKFSYASHDPVSLNFLNVSRHTDALGHESLASYDQRGNLISFTDPTDHTVLMLRDRRGLPLVIRDVEGAMARFSWTAEGWLAEERGARGGRLRYRRDGFGRVIEEAVEGAGAIRLRYDVLDRLVEVVAADGRPTRMTYDADGNLIEHVDPAGNRTAWDFAGLPAPVLRTNPDGTRFRYSYDSELNLIGLQNESGEIYALEYDADERLIGEIGFDSRRQRYHYDAAGHVIRYEDGHRGHQLTRDPLGRLLLRQCSDGSWASYRFDALGRMTKAENEVRRIGFIYDPRGLVARERHDGVEIAHVLSQRGERVATILPDGRRIGYGYDQDSQFEQLSFQDREVLRLTRDRIGRETLREGGSIGLQTEYDPEGRIERQRAYRRRRDAPVFGRSYSYDNAGLIRSIRDVARGERAFQYDSREQLRRVSGATREVFAFDPAGNILVDVESPRNASVVGGRLLMRGDTHYRYDDAGNRIEMRRGWGGRHVYQLDYDDMNQLTEVRETSGGVHRTTRFSYDALGRRVVKHHREETAPLVAANDVTAGSASRMAQLTAEETTWFLWDGDTLLAEGKGDMSGPRDAFAIVYVHEPGSFRPAAQIRRSSPEYEGQVLLYWNDHLGTPHEVTNERGELVWQVALKAWGGIDRVHVERVENNLRFQGQYFDPETGLHYNRFRHYDPQAGCYINQDPIGLAGGAVLAGYAVNALQWTDPLGLTTWDDFRSDNKGLYDRQQLSDAYARAYPKPSVQPGAAVHGNSHASTRTTYGYIIREINPDGTNGRILKFGETSSPIPTQRYSARFYRTHNARMIPVKVGTKAEMHRWQHERIMQYKDRHGVRPALNKCNY